MLDQLYLMGKHLACGVHTQNPEFWGILGSVFLQIKWSVAHFGNIIDASLTNVHHCPPAIPEI